MVAGQLQIAFAAVDDDPVDGVRGTEFHICWKHPTSHAQQTGAPRYISDLFGIQLGGMVVVTPAKRGRVFFNQEFQGAGRSVAVLMLPGGRMAVGRNGARQRCVRTPVPMRIAGTLGDEATGFDTIARSDQGCHRVDGQTYAQGRLEPLDGRICCSF